MNLETSFTDTFTSGMEQSVREGKSGNGWLRSSNVEFEVKVVANSLALSEDRL